MAITPATAFPGGRQKGLINVICLCHNGKGKRDLFIQMLPEVGFARK